MTSSSRPRGNGTTAVATRQPATPQAPAPRQPHPLIVALEERMPAIAEMLPDGMDAQRFRRVVVQALARNPQLLNCTPVSVITAITEAAEAGLEPTGVLGRAWLIPYGRDAKLIIGYRGYAELAWRADRVLLTVDVVREGDTFEYQRGTNAFLRHVPSDDPDRELDDSNITYAYCLARFPDGREDFEVMSTAAVLRIRDRARTKNPVWDSDLGEMMKKTPVRRILKRLPLSPTVQRFIAGDEAVDFDTPVERVAAQPSRADGLRSRIHDRTAALRGEQPAAAAVAVADVDDDGPPPAAEPAAAEIDVDDLPFDPEAGASTGDTHHASGGASAAAPASPACTHPADRYQATGAGVTCGDCGELVAQRDSEPMRPRAVPARTPREALMARIHVGHTHEQAKAFAASVLGIDPNAEWSMTELLDDELQAVVDAMRDEEARRGARQARRQPAGAGARSR
jgi:recombination protein RecT